MEITINKDITKIRETMIYGLPLRETVFAVITMIVGLSVFLSLDEYVLNARAIISAVLCSPFAVLAFFKYQGLKAEQIALELLRSVFLPKVCVLEPENEYAKALKPCIRERKREALKNDKISAKKRKREKRALQNTSKNAGLNTVEEDL